VRLTTCMSGSATRSCRRARIEPDFTAGRGSRRHLARTEQGTAGERPRSSIARPAPPVRSDCVIVEPGSGGRNPSAASVRHGLRRRVCDQRTQRGRDRTYWKMKKLSHGSAAIRDGDRCAEIAVLQRRVASLLEAGLHLMESILRYGRDLLASSSGPCPEASAT